MAVWSRVLQDGQVRAMAGVYDLTGRNEKTSPIPEGRSGLRNKANPRERAQFCGTKPIRENGHGFAEQRQSEGAGVVLRNKANSRERRGFAKQSQSEVRRRNFCGTKPIRGSGPIVVCRGLVASVKPVSGLGVFVMRFEMFNRSITGFTRHYEETRVLSLLLL